MKLSNLIIACACLAGLSSAAFASGGPVALASGPSNVILRSTLSVDTSAHTAVLPLYHGVSHGKSVWYIITDASNADVARKLNVVYAPALGSIGSAATQHVSRNGNTYVFDGAPDFSKTRTYVASKGGFPPAAFTPGAVADAAYSPFVQIDGMSGVLNASIVATGNGPFDVTHHTNTADRLIAIDTTKKTATFLLARGFFNNRAVLYLSTEASVPVAASVERAIYTPKLSKASPAAQISIGVIVSGSRSVTGPQGLAYLALDTPLGSDATPANVSTIGSPFNVLSQIPNVLHPFTDNGYSPLWDVQVVGKSRVRITNYAAFASASPKPAGFSVNCPVIAFEK